MYPFAARVRSMCPEQVLRAWICPQRFLAFWYVAALHLDFCFSLSGGNCLFPVIVLSAQGLTQSRQIPLEMPGTLEFCPATLSLVSSSHFESMGLKPNQIPYSVRTRCKGKIWIWLFSSPVLWHHWNILLKQQIFCCCIYYCDFHYRYFTLMKLKEPEMSPQP